MTQSQFLSSLVPSTFSVSGSRPCFITGQRRTKAVAVIGGMVHGIILDNTNDVVLRNAQKSAVREWVAKLQEVSQQ